MANIGVNASTSWNVVTLANHILSILAKQAHVVSLLDADKCYSGRVPAILLKLLAGRSNGGHFVCQDQLELPFTNTIAVHDNLKKSMLKRV